MILSISPRLAACAGFVPPGSRVADIGCDHGYLGIYLLRSGIACGVLAADINQGPLHSALHNAHKYGVADRMSFYLSDGAQKIPRDFDVLICAGMGADTIRSILEAAPWLRSDRYQLIFQCQSKTPALRRYLSENGWYISRETALQDGKFLYTVMAVQWAPDRPRLTEGDWYFPKALLEDPHAAAADYYQYVLRGLQIATTHRQDPEKAQALAQLQPLADIQNWLKGEKS